MGVHGEEQRMYYGRDKSDGTGKLISFSGTLTLSAMGRRSEEETPDLLQNLKLDA